MKKAKNGVCAARKCEGMLKNITPLMMGPAFECVKCGLKYDLKGNVWRNK